MEEVMKDLVSVIIPTYNRASFLTQAIRSVLNQTYQDWELIVVDDGSKDNTGDIVGGFKAKDKRIEYFYQVNKGAGAARNSGIRKSLGNYIAFLDSDDEWLPEKLVRQVDFMKNNPGYDFCYTADKVVSSDKEVGIKRYRNITDLSFIKLAGIGIGVPSSHIYRKAVFERVGLFNEERDLIGLEDNEWSVRGHFLKGFYLDEPSTVYRRHSGQITRENIVSIGKQLSGLEYILQEHFLLISQNIEALIFRFQQLGHLYLLSGDYEQARENIWKAIRLNPLKLSSLALAAISVSMPFLYKPLIKLKNAIRI